MILPATIDTSRLDDYTDDQLVELLVDGGYSPGAARHAMRMLRGEASEVPDGLMEQALARADALDET